MVDFTRTETQEQLVQTARDFGREVLQPAEIAIDANPDPDEAFESKAFKAAMAKAFELGFHKMSLPESVGGLGLDASTTGMVWEELARWGVGFAASLMAGSVVPQLVSFAAGHNKHGDSVFLIEPADEISAIGAKHAGILDASGWGDRVQAWNV